MSKTSQRILRYLIIVAVFLVVAAIGYRIYQIQQEKRDFAKAEQSIDSLAQQIEQLIGKPDETRDKNSCGYANRVYGNGPLGCSVSKTLWYKERSTIDANELMKRVSGVTDKKIYHYLGKDDVTAFNEEDPDQSFSQDIDAINSLSCGIQYTYSAEEDRMGFLLSCGGQTIHKIYPVT